MSMDLTEDCPHCKALVGQICKENCTANGNYIKTLKTTLLKIGLTIKNITIQPNKLDM